LQNKLQNFEKTTKKLSIVLTTSLVRMNT